MVYRRVAAANFFQGLNKGCCAAEPVSQFLEVMKVQSLLALADGSSCQGRFNGFALVIVSAQEPGQMLDLAFS